MDEFFTNDAFLQSDELLCKNYCFTLDADPTAIVAAFTLSNDSIKLERPLNSRLMYFDLIELVKK